MLPLLQLYRQHKAGLFAKCNSLISLPADLHEHKAKLSPNMLALMQELEKQGPHFASKMLITVLGRSIGSTTRPA